MTHQQCRVERYKPSKVVTTEEDFELR